MTSEANPGLKVVEAIRTRLSIDIEWSAPLPSGFIWWPYNLSQSIWADQPAFLGGKWSCRVWIVSDFLSGISGSSDDVPPLNEVAGKLGVAGMVSNRTPGGRLDLKLVSSMWVHEETAGWVGSYLPTVAVMQAHQAFVYSRELEAAGIGKVDVSHHPSSGPRPIADELLVNGKAATRNLARGHDPDGAFSGASLLEAYAYLLQDKDCLLTTPQEDGVTAEYPCPVPGKTLQTTLLTARLTDDFEGFGRGIVLRLHLPVDRITPSTTYAAFLEFNELTHGDKTYLLRGIGGWHYHDHAWTHTVFYADMMHTNDRDLSNWIRYEADRALWAAEVLYGLDWRQDLEGQRRRLLE